MKIKFTTACFIVSSLLFPALAHAAASEVDSKPPLIVIKDSVITSKVKANLANDTLSSLRTIGVDTEHKGAVILSGRVRTQTEADKAVSIARATKGVTSVKSNIRIILED